MSVATPNGPGCAGPGCRRATRAVRAGIDRDPAFGAVVPPLVLSSNFSFEGFDRKRAYDYTPAAIRPGPWVMTLRSWKAAAGLVVTATMARSRWLPAGAPVARGTHLCSTTATAASGAVKHGGQQAFD